MLPFIHTVETWYAPGRDLLCRLADRALVLYPPRALPILQPLLTRRGEVDDTQTITAYVDHGRWIACCPFCPSAQVVSPEDPFFLCAGDDGCVNLPIQGAYVAVVFPDETTQQDVEAVLLERPAMSTRNWLPDETADDLLAENVANDVTPSDVTVADLVAVAQLEPAIDTPEPALGSANVHITEAPMPASFDAASSDSEGAV